MSKKKHHHNMNQAIKLTREYRKLITYIIQALSCWIVVSIFVPFSPLMPTEGLDPSWAFGMNQVIEQKFSFGKEIVFTFGPYASIFTRRYHPATDITMVIGALYLAVSYWIGLLATMKSSASGWLLAFPIILAGAVYSQDTLFFSFPLLVAFSSINIASTKTEDRASKTKTIVLVLILFFPFGLYPLIKGSMLILCGVMTALSALFFLLTKRIALALTCLLSPIISILLFWIIADQSIKILPDYINQTVLITANYTEAMAKSGRSNEIIIYLITSSLLLLTILKREAQPNWSKPFLLVAISFFLFVSFKGAFVRHDGHAVIAGASILIAGILVCATIKSKATYISMIATMISWFYISSSHVDLSIASFFHHIKSTHSASWNGIKTRLTQQDWLENNFQTAIASIREKFDLPILYGTTDIYSYNQSYLIASGNRWNPRPVIQSYAAYSPTLAYANQNHLLETHAPDNIIFKIEPIDGRVPSSEDGVSWPELLKNYEPTKMKNSFLFLEKRNITNKEQKLSVIHTGTYFLGQNVQAPKTKKMLFAEIDIQPNAQGKIASTLFKTSQLYLEIELMNGVNKRYRLISNMARSGFLLSPFIENTAEFGLLYGDKSYLSDKKIKSFTISSDSLTGDNLWKNEYSITFKEFEPPEPKKISNLFDFETIFEAPPNWEISTTIKCHEHIDKLNDAAPANHISIGNILKIQGWLSPSATTKTMPESIYIVLTDEQGKHLFLNTRRTLRPDVAAHFKNPIISTSGYISTADISALTGVYTLSLGFKEKGNHIKICPRYRIQTTKAKLN